jgi:competence protein ComEC
LAVAAAAWARTRLYARYRPLVFSSAVPRFVPPAAVLSGLLLLLAALLQAAGHGGARVTFLDVGQGDCSLVRTGSGRSVLIDGGGTRDNRFDVGRRIVAPFLWDQGIGTLDLVVLSHPHPDHMNGLLSVLRSFRVRAVWWSGQDGTAEGFEGLRRLAQERSVPLRAVSAGDRLSIDDADIEVLHPSPATAVSSRRVYAAENDRSLVLRLRAEGTTFLFPGDLHREAEAALVRSGRSLRADVIKAPHHGSRTSSSEAFVGAVQPKAAVISVGAGNPYRQPADEVVTRYQAAGAEVLRTDRHGAVIAMPSPSGPALVRWTDLVLEKIALDRIGEWGERERRNWERAWIRTAGI